MIAGTDPTVHGSRAAPDDAEARTDPTDTDPTLPSLLLSQGEQKEEAQLPIVVGEEEEEYLMPRSLERPTKSDGEDWRRCCWIMNQKLPVR